MRGEKSDHLIEQRGNLRASVCLGMELRVGDKHFVGHTENISLCGAMVTSEVFSHDPEIVGCEAQIWLAFEEAFEEYQCVVVHTSHRGIGVKFIHRDDSSIEKLREMIASVV